MWVSSTSPLNLSLIGPLTTEIYYWTGITGITNIYTDRRTETHRDWIWYSPLMFRYAMVGKGKSHRCPCVVTKFILHCLIDRLSRRCNHWHSSKSWKLYLLLTRINIFFSIQPLDKFRNWFSNKPKRANKRRKYINALIT